jgi:hypothetical protein
MIEVDSVASPVGAYIRIANLPFAVKQLAENAGETIGTCWWLNANTGALTAIAGSVFESVNYVDLIVNAALIEANDQFKFGFSYFAD